VHRSGLRSLAVCALVAATACDLGYTPPCRVSDRQTLATLAADPIVLLRGDAIDARVLAGDVMHTLTYDLDGALLAETRVPVAADVPSDGAFLGDREARVSVVRDQILLPPVPDPDGGPAITPKALRDRLQLTLLMGGTTAQTTPLPLVDCDQCVVAFIGVRAIGDALVVLWQTADATVANLAAIDTAGNVLARAPVQLPPISLLALQRFRASPQPDFAVLETIDPAGNPALVLFDDRVQVVRGDLTSGAVLGWDLSGDRLMQVTFDSAEHLRAAIFSFAAAVPSARSFSFLRPMHAAPSGELSGIVGDDGTKLYLVAIDARGKKLGGDLPIADQAAGPADLLGAVPSGVLVAQPGRRFVYVRASNGALERIGVACEAAK
jgi:hypothetical protein